MNELERQLQYPLGEALPACGGTLEVAPGVHWVRMGLPFALDHINLWLLRDRLDEREGWTLVDCGISNDATRAAWEQVFAEQLQGLPVLRVIVTHMHPDHVGLAHWLCERWSTPARACRLWMSASDYHVALRAGSHHDGVGGSAAAAFMQGHGLDDLAALARIRERGNHYARMVPSLPGHYRRLLDGDQLRIGAFGWRCIVGHGHAPEHISFYCAEAGVMVSGDMVLPRISTNVSVTEGEPEADPLRRYLDSIERLRTLPADTLVLPSHGRPFRGLHTRIDQLQAHHHDRLADVLHACAEAPQTAAALLQLLFRRPLDPHQTGFAMGEAIAHLHLPWLDGRLRRAVDASGVHWFTAA